MKVGILTYHFAKNYGAVLQCYALKQELTVQGFDVDVINYINDLQYDNNVLYGKIGLKKFFKNILLLPFDKLRRRKYKKFESFIIDNLSLTNRIKSVNDLKNKVDNYYDIILVGSDQVWNPRIDDFDASFFLPFDTSAKKVSYAASIGGSCFCELIKYKEYLSDFDYITVRENNAVEELKHIEVDVDNVLCDPVFLLTIEQWKSLINNKTPKFDEYIVCYFLHQQHNYVYKSIVERYAENNKLKVVNIVTRFRPSSVFGNCVYDAGPEEFLELIDGAKYVFTDSFHGTAFSTVLNKNFTCFCTSVNSTDNRKKGLLEKLSLEDRICYLDDIKENYNHIDYSIIERNIAKLREEGAAFLANLKKIN